MNMKRLNNKIIQILEEQGFKVHDIEKHDEEYYVEINQHTPAGEDWWEHIIFNGTNKDFIEQICERTLYFDVDDEVEVLIKNRGKNGIPNSITILVDDARWKLETLEIVCNNLNKIRKDV